MGALGQRGNDLSCQLLPLHKQNVRTTVCQVIMICLCPFIWPLNCLQSTPLIKLPTWLLRELKTSAQLFFPIWCFSCLPFHYVSYLISLFCIQFSIHNRKIHQCISVTTVFTLHKNLAMPFNLTLISRILKFSQWEM